MPKAVIFRSHGGPEVLEPVNIASPKAPQKGQVLIRQKAIGVNFIDIYYRKGWYKASRLPMVPGIEACGVVEAIGEGVKAEVGQRVAYATTYSGGYCEQRLIDQKYLFGVPDTITDEVAAGTLAKAMTAHYLIYRTYRLSKNDTILVHAAAGGVGQMLCQWAKLKGARVIGVVSTDQKASIANSCGCDLVIVSSRQNIPEEVGKFTNKRGVNVVYDSVGKETFMSSLQSLGPLGLLVSYGQSSGMIPPINIMQLSSRGAYITRPSLQHYKSLRGELVLTALEIYKKLEQKKLRPQITSYPLQEAAKVHGLIEGRKTTGASVLML